MSAFLQVLPLAFVMVAGPQILSVIFFATTDQWRDFPEQTWEAGVRRRQEAGRSLGQRRGAGTRGSPTG